MSERFSPKPLTRMGKGSLIDRLPSRHSRDIITGQDQVSRMMGHYGKRGPREPVTKSVTKPKAAPKP